MRNIRIIEHISLDGVIQAPGGPKEDSSGGFKYGGWSAPLSDPEGGKAIVAAHGDAFRSAAGPPHIRYLEQLLAHRSEESDDGFH